MRMQGIKHLSQVRTDLLETTGGFSVLLYPHDEVRYGLPLLPKQYQAVTQIDAEHLYACTYFGHVDRPSAPDEFWGRCYNKCRSQSRAINNRIVRQFNFINFSLYRY